MAKGDLFKRSLEAGTSFLDMTRERAESMVKEWVDAGDLGRSRAQKAVEQVLDRSRRATEELRALVRKEIGDQLAVLGVATRDDLARLEAKIDAVTAPTGPGVADVPPSPPASTGVSTGAAAAAARAAAKTKKATAPKKTTAGTTRATAARTGASPAPGAVKPAKGVKAVKAVKAVKGVKGVKAVKAVKKATPRKAAPGPGAGPRPGT